MLSGKPSTRREVISGTPRHDGAVVAEDQEPLARAFGQVRAPGESSRQASGWATVDQGNRRFAAACAAAGLDGRGDACRAAGLLPIAMAVNCTKLDLVEPESPTFATGCQGGSLCGCRGVQISRRAETGFVIEVIEGVHPGTFAGDFVRSPRERGRWPQLRPALGDAAKLAGITSGKR